MAGDTHWPAVVWMNLPFCLQSNHRLEDGVYRWWRVVSKPKGQRWSWPLKVGRDIQSPRSPSSPRQSNPVAEDCNQPRTTLKLFLLIYFSKIYHRGTVTVVFLQIPYSYTLKATSSSASGIVKFRRRCRTSLCGLRCLALLYLKRLKRK